MDFCYCPCKPPEKGEFYQVFISIVYDLAQNNFLHSIVVNINATRLSLVWKSSIFDQK